MKTAFSINMIRSVRLARSVFFTAVLLLPLLCGCGSKQPITKSGFYFDTVITVTLYDPSKTKELDHCFALAELYESYFSAQRKDSDISKINANAGHPVRVHKETRQLLEQSILHAKQSGGKFDPTIGRLTSLWDFHAKPPALPDADAVKAAAATVDYRKIVIDENEVTLSDADAALDLGGIAKGYIADKMKAYLQGEGITSGLINLGVNVLAIGEKPDGSAYTIGIQKPFDETGEPIASVSVSDQTVVTSGIYERSFTLDGRCYHHILDTDTGYPYENELLSVSVICASSADGDGLSTACFALGLEKGLAYIESLDQTEAIFITSDYKLHGTSGIGTTIPIKEMSD